MSQEWIVPMKEDTVAFCSCRQGNNLYSVPEIINKYFTSVELFILHREPSGKS